MPTWTALSQADGRDAAEDLAEACDDLTPEPVGSGVFEIEDGSELAGVQVGDVEQLARRHFSAAAMIATASSSSASVTLIGGASRIAVGVTALVTSPRPSRSV